MGKSIVVNGKPKRGGKTMNLNPTGKGGFTRENPRPGPGRGKRKPLPAMGQDAFLDMKKAYEEPERSDDSPGVKAARLLLKNDYQAFMKIYAGMLAKQEATERTEVRGTIEAGPQEETILELAERLLRECRGG